MINSGYFLLDLKIENVMLRNKLKNNGIKGNELVFIDIGAHLKYTDN